MFTKFRPIATAAACLVISHLGAGCEQRVVYSGWETLDPVTGGGYYDAPRGGSSTADVPAGSTWSIAMDQYAGVDHRRLAEQRASDLGRATGMPRFRAADEGDKSTIFYGSYASPQDAAAQQDLGQLRRLNETLGLRLSGMMLVPIVAKGGGVDVADIDLRSASGRGVYTLQVGFYESEPGKELDARKAAEQAAAALRKDGHAAYYFHGPNRSMVTVGVFGEEAIVSFNDGRRIRTEYAEPVKRLQRQFPHNLANGMVLEETRDGVTNKLPSFLVRIPAR